MRTVPMFPLGATVLPGSELPLNVFEPRYQALVNDVLAAPDGPDFGVVLITRGHEVGGGDERSDVGVLVRIRNHRQMSGGRFALDCVAGQRIKVVCWLPDDPYPRAEIAVWPDEENGSEWVALQQVDAAVIRLRETLTRLAQRRERGVPRIPTTADLSGSPGERLYSLAARCPLGDSDRQTVLAAPGVADRARVLAEALTGATEIVEFELLQS
ncbi:ATP-dependent protease [Nocardia stercoris]|uniref:ATP-dependent protease n=1 Tax=Nocardia stercoris TaxID=2483361 RepID=A0A3M2LCK9_9NOCA|nr:LON peptidase substrate-binding domain-containing protein [Nocardia stercoris]RMI32428.1 ATP-dependent protease [Nocardia stercoris]